MYSCVSCDENPEHLYSYQYMTTLAAASVSTSTNKFVYFKQHLTDQSSEPMKVLVNPNFNKKVFVNPKFNGTIKNITSPTPVPKIHVNPNAQNLKLVTGFNDYKNVGKIHVNPNILRNIPISTKNTIVEDNCIKNMPKCSQEEPENHSVIPTRIKLVHSIKSIPENKIRKRRSSVKSQFKIIKSALLEKPLGNENRIKSKYKFIKPNQYNPRYSNDFKPVINKFKVDNRNSKAVDVCLKNKKYVYVNRFLSISDIARNSLLKQNKNKFYAVNVELYKKCPNSSKKTSNPYKKTNNLKKSQGNGICKSKYKFMRKSTSNSVRHNQSLKVSRLKKTTIKSASKLRICNIPCPYYRKFGRCKGKESGKCYRKHDPDQIALCTNLTVCLSASIVTEKHYTIAVFADPVLDQFGMLSNAYHRFLQGACIDKKCLLSHNVSPEKMPTCKYYLEGSCSRDDCPFLHVRISPKADICKDFLEGFCRKAAQCNKRHQYLCPDYEKNGNCLKQRCPYPHGKMVRKYSEFNKNKFAKKSSNEHTNNNCNKLMHKIKHTKSETVKSEGPEVNVKSRYYIGQNELDTEEICNTNQNNCDDHVIDQEVGIKSRPKLGKLPSYIAFENI